MVSLIDLLQKSYPNANPHPPTTSNDSLLELSKFSPFEDVHYTTEEKSEIQQWLTTAAHLPGGDKNQIDASDNTTIESSSSATKTTSAQTNNTEDEAKIAARLSSLNTHLATHTTVLGAKPSVADIAIFARLAPVVRAWNADQRTGEQGYHHIVRHVDYVQNAPVFGLQLTEDERVPLDVADVRSVIKPVDAKAEKERKKKEKAAAVAAAKGIAGGDNASTEAGGISGDKAAVAGAAAASTAGVADTGAAAASTTNKKKEKKEKGPKPAKAAPPAAAEKKALSPGLIDFRVGHILKAERHPNADSLYVSRIAVGDATGAENTEELDGRVVRTVCSGLNGKVPLEEMQGRRVVAVCNLKPVTMRGIKSAAMVLAASEPAKEEEGKGGDPHGGGGRVELVNPPEGAEAGDKVYFDGWQAEPETILNPKKKVWETCQAGFTTTSDKIVGFDPAKVPQLAAEEGTSAKSAAAAATKGVALLKTKNGTCTVKSLVGAEVR